MRRTSDYVAQPQPPTSGEQFPIKFVKSKPSDLGHTAGHGRLETQPLKRPSNLDGRRAYGRGGAASYSKASSETALGP